MLLSLTASAKSQCRPLHAPFPSSLVTMLTGPFLCLLPQNTGQWQVATASGKGEVIPKKLTKLFRAEQSVSCSFRAVRSSTSDHTSRQM